METKPLMGWTDPLVPDVVSNEKQQGSGLFEFQDDGDH